MFQHLYAQAVAEHLHAELYITDMSTMLHELGIGRVPVNTVDGDRNVDFIVDDRMKWDLLPSTHPAKKKCRNGNFSFSQRPVDKRRRVKNGNASDYDNDILSFLNPDGRIECLVSVGFFVQKNFCVSTAKKFWHKLTHVFDYFPNFEVPFGADDYVLHLRCAKRHPSYNGHSNIVLIYMMHIYLSLLNVILRNFIFLFD